MNERIIYCCDHFLPWFLYWDYTGLSSTRSYFSGLCRYPWYYANRRANFWILFEMQALAYKIYDCTEKMEENTHHKNNATALISQIPT